MLSGGVGGLSISANFPPRWQGTLRVSPVILEPVSYAIGLPTASPLRESINRALLGIIEQDRWRDVEHQYLGHS